MRTLLVTYSMALWCLVPDLAVNKYGGIHYYGMSESMWHDLKDVEKPWTAVTWSLTCHTWNDYDVFQRPLQGVNLTGMQWYVSWEKLIFLINSSPTYCHSKATHLDSSLGGKHIGMGHRSLHPDGDHAGRSMGARLCWSVLWENHVGSKPLRFEASIGESERHVCKEIVQKN